MPKDTFVKNHKCTKCHKKCKTHGHHIIYDPEVITELCPYCHSIITSINTRYCKWKELIKLTNEERNNLYNFFLVSEMGILEALLRKKRKTKEVTVKTKVKRIDKGVNTILRKNYGKNNPLWREDEVRAMEREYQEQWARMLSLRQG